MALNGKLGQVAHMPKGIVRILRSTAHRLAQGDIVPKVGQLGLRRTFAVVAALVFGVLTPAVVLGVTPTLEGETAYAVSSNVRTDPPATGFTYQATCDPSGTSTVRYSGYGPAVGPYPGTFTESGVLTIGPQQPIAGGGGLIGIVQSFSADFTITSGTTTITGHKVLGAANAPATCTQGIIVGPQIVDTVQTSFSSDYVATIQTSTETCHDSGRAGNDFSIYDTHTTDPTTGVVTFAYDDGMSVDWHLSSGLTDCVASGPAAVTLTPPDAVNTVGTNHTVTATVTNSAGGAVPNASVLFSTSGSTSASGSCTTDANGQCTFTYAGPQLPGADIIMACADANKNGAGDPGEPCAEATKAWMLPASTAGQTTGGGQVLNAAGNDKIAFGFNAKSTSNGLQGNCTVVDPSPATNVKIKCLDVTSLVQTGTHATVFGNATVNGTATTYRIDVDDLGEPGAGHDTFKIQTSSGYTAGGTLTNGNIQIHN
jgi:hypothetical protein